ncbi:MAG: glycosyltransferase family 9 protein [Ignavibacteria bacterium]|nr:glycosyltransferase family 9 protein [Ignavibacteria bacterium]
MAEKVFLRNIFLRIFRALLGVEENASRELGNPQKILIIRQHNQLGDLLAGVSLFRALKETYPDLHISLVVSPFNYPGMVKNKFLDRIYIFDKKRLLNPSYLVKTWRLLRESYDLAIVPVVVSISFTSNLIARISKSKIRIGAKSLEGKPNHSAFFFDKRVDLDWRRHPDSNVSERSLDIVRPFRINTKNYTSEISFNGTDTSAADNFINEIAHEKKKYLIGLHAGAGKQNNRWSLEKYASLIKKIEADYPANFYLTVGQFEKDYLNCLEKKVDVKIGKYTNKTIPQVAALISKSDLFISNDTGIMHVAGTTKTPQISIFGPTNPFNWAPIGSNKYFIRKSELIEDVSVEDVFHLCTIILNDREIKK